MRTKLENTIFGKLRFNDKIKKTRKFYKRGKTKNEKLKEQRLKLKY